MNLSYHDKVNICRNDNENLNKAIVYYHNNKGKSPKITYHTIEKKYSITSSTFSRHYNNFLANDSVLQDYYQTETKQTFTDEQEKYLWSLILIRAQYGKAFNKHEFLEFAFSFLETLNTPSNNNNNVNLLIIEGIDIAKNKDKIVLESKIIPKLCRSWFNNFVLRCEKRFSDGLGYRTPEELDADRGLVDINILEENHKNFIELCNECNIDLSINKDLKRVINFDEMGISGDKKGKTNCKPSAKLLVPQSVKTRAINQNHGNRDHITVISGGNAFGMPTPNVFIVKSTSKKYEIDKENDTDKIGEEETNDDFLVINDEDNEEDGEYGTCIPLNREESGGLLDAFKTKSRTSYVNSKIIQDFFRILDDWIIDNNIPKPVIVAMDGCLAHMKYELLNEADQRNIKIFVFPAHSSQTTQPMDGLPNLETKFEFFRLLKLQKNKLKLKEGDMIKLFGKSLSIGNSPNNIRHAWINCGYTNDKFNPNNHNAYSEVPNSCLKSEISPLDRIENTSKFLVNTITDLTETDDNSLIKSIKIKSKKNLPYETIGYINSNENLQIMTNYREELENTKQIVVKNNELIQNERKRKSDEAIVTKGLKEKINEEKLKCIKEFNLLSQIEKDSYLKEQNETKKNISKEKKKLNDNKTRKNNLIGNGLEIAVKELNNITPLLKQLDNLSITLDATRELLSEKSNTNENNNEVKNNLLELKNEISLSKSSIISKLKNITSSPALQIVNESNDMDVSNNNNNSSSSNSSRSSNSSSTINTISSTLSSENIISSKRMRNSSHKKSEQINNLQLETINKIPNKKKN
jgi:hypothetical protein